MGLTVTVPKRNNTLMDTSVIVRDGLGVTEIAAPLSEVWAGLTEDHQYWIDYRAVGGLQFSPDGTVKRMTVGECARILGVAERTLYHREKSIPRFMELVAMRRSEKFSDKIVGAAWNATALKAAKGDDAAVERILTNFDPNYKSPKQTHELELGDNMVEVFAMMRKQAQIIDGDYTEADTGAGSLDIPERATDIPEKS